MTNGRSFDKEAVYEIRVMGKLDQTWSDWFDGFRITNQDDETVLVGAVTDQAALLGLLAKISNLGLPMITVKRKMEKE